MKEMELTKTQLEAAVIRRAWESEEFKQKLFADPKEALNELGYNVAHNVEICVHQEHKNKMVLVLPENPLGAMHDIFNVNPAGPNTPHITLVGPACGGGPDKPRGPEPQAYPPDTRPSKCRMSEPQTKPQSPDVPNATYKGGSCNTAVHCVDKPKSPSVNPKQSPDIPNATYKGGSCNTAVHCIEKPSTPPPTPGPAGPSKKM